MTKFIDPFAPKRKAEYEKGAATPKSTHHENGTVRGTTKEVLAWVGDDAERAKLALDAENGDDKPRKGLVRELEDLVPAAAAETPDQSGGADGEGSTGGSGAPDAQTADAGDGDVTGDKDGVDPDAGGSEGTEGTDVPADQLADTGQDEGVEPDGAAGGNDSTPGSGVPESQVADAEADEK